MAALCEKSSQSWLAYIRRRRHFYPFCPRANEDPQPDPANPFRSLIRLLLTPPFFARFFCPPPKVDSDTHLSPVSERRTNDDAVYSFFLFIPRSVLVWLPEYQIRLLIHPPHGLMSGDESRRRRRKQSFLSLTLAPKMTSLLGSYLPSFYPSFSSSFVFWRREKGRGKEKVTSD